VTEAGTSRNDIYARLVGARGAAPFVWIVVLLVVVLVVDFLSTGIWTVKQDEKGVVLRFGKAVRSLGPGFHVTLPYPFETLVVVNISETRKMPVGFRLVPGRDPTPPSVNEREWLTGDTNVIDIKMMIHYVISDPVAYLFRVGEDEASFLIRKCSESLLTRIIATMHVDHVFTTGKVEIQTAVRDGVQELLDEIGAGVRILSANIQEVSPPEEVKSAFNDVSRAKADKERAVQEADGYIKEREPRARAQANTIIQAARIYEDTTVSGAKGSARRFVSLLEEYTQAKTVTRTRLLLETLERVLSRTQNIVVDESSDGKSPIKMVR